MASSERNQTVGVEETCDGAGKSHTQYAESRQHTGVIGFQGCMAAQRQPYEQNSNNCIVTLLHRHDQDDNSQDKEDGQQNEGKNQG